MYYIEWNKKAFCIAVFWMILSSNFNHFCRVKKNPSRNIQVALGYSFWWWNFYIQLFMKKLFWAFRPRPCNQYLFTIMNWLKCLKGTYRQLEIQFQTKRQLFEKITTSRYFILTRDNKGLIWTAHNESPGHDQIWWISDHTILYLFTSEISALVFCLILVYVYISQHATSLEAGLS